jgi:hypothetical protein
MADAAKSSATPQAAAPVRQPARGPAPGLGAALGTNAQAVLGLHATAGNRAVSELLGSGRPLEAGLRVDMESRFGASFEHVRLHDDRAAHRSAALLEAKAFTHGEHIVFGEDRFAPQGPAGKRLLAHALAHVVQQRRGGAAPALDADAAHVRAAHRAADAVAAGSGPVAVAGATAVGVARDEDDSFIGRMKRKAQALKDSIPPEYAAKAQQAADFVADKAVDVALAPVGGALAADGLGSRLLHVAQGKGDAGEELKGFARDKALEGIGAVKGVVTQVTEVGDTAMWFGNEYGELRDKAAEAIGGKPGSPGHEMVKNAIDLGVAATPGGVGIVQASKANDLAKKAGWVDKSGHASVTEPMARKMNEAGEWIEDKVGGKSENPMFFTPMEKGELEGAIGSQVLLAFTGAEEVKVGLAVVGLAGSVRGIVESIRADRNGFYKNPAFWGSILTAALSVAGLSKLKAAKRIVDIALKGGALLSVVPPLWQLYNDYNDPKLEAGDPDERHKVLARDWNAVIRATVDALLVIAHAGMKGEAPPKEKAPGGLGEPEGRAPKTGSGEGTGNTVADDPTAKPQAGSSNEAQDAPKPATAKQQKKADALADTAEATAKTQKERADASQEKANEIAGKAKKALAKAEEQRQKADAAKDAHAKKRAEAQDKKDAPTKEREKAERQANSAKKAADDAAGVADRAEKKLPGADKRAQDAQQAADRARQRADDAAAKAQAARDKANAMKPPVDPETVFDPSDPAFAPAPDAQLKPNAEPLVWVRTGKGKARGTYVPEDSPRFGKGEGTARPRSVADAEGFRPAGTDPDVKPIQVRRVGGRQVESKGAGGNKGGKFVSATAKDANAVSTTSIRPDVAEAHAYNEHINQGEYGLQRPLGSNAPGVDSITASIQFDANGKPVSAKIFLNDVTTPTAAKGSKPAHAAWGGELGKALEPGTLDFGDPAIDAVLRKAAADGNVFVRIVRVDMSPKGGGAMRIDPAETWRLGPTPLPPLLLQPPKPDRKDDDDGGDAP